MELSILIAAIVWEDTQDCSGTFFSTFYIWQTLFFGCWQLH